MSKTSDRKDFNDRHYGKERFETWTVAWNRLLKMNQENRSRLAPGKEGRAQRAGRKPLLSQELVVVSCRWGPRFEEGKRRNRHYHVLPRPPG